MNQNAYIIGFDIGGTHARSTLLKINNPDSPKILKENIQSSRDNQTPEKLSLLILNSVLQYAEEFNFQPSQLKNIGIAIAALIHKDKSTVINAPNLKWKNINFEKILKESLQGFNFNTPILLENDLNAILWGEAQMGAAKFYDNVLALYLGTGLGTAIIIEKKLYRGANNLAGELGHAKTPLSNQLCGCGQFSCVESIASGIAIEKKLANDLKENIITAEDLGLGPNDKPTPLSAEYAYKNNLTYALKYWNDTAEILADTASAAITLLDPNALLLGGGVFSVAPSLKKLFSQKLLLKIPEAIGNNLKILQPTLNHNAGTIGAAMLAFMENHSYHE